MELFLLVQEKVIFLKTKVDGGVHAVIPKNGAFEVKRIIKDLIMPVGVAYHRGSLYVSAVSRVLRYDDIENRLNNPPQPVVVSTFPSDMHHGLVLYQLTF